MWPPSAALQALTTSSDAGMGQWLGKLEKSINAAQQISHANGSHIGCSCTCLAHTASGAGVPLTTRGRQGRLSFPMLSQAKHISPQVQLTFGKRGMGFYCSSWVNQTFKSSLVHETAQDLGLLMFSSIRNMANRKGPSLGGGGDKSKTGLGLGVRELLHKSNNTSEILSLLPGTNCLETRGREHSCS